MNFLLFKFFLDRVSAFMLPCKLQHSLSFFEKKMELGLYLFILF